jgi:hypothetical protein
LGLGLGLFRLISAFIRTKLISLSVTQSNVVPDNL